MARTVVAFVHLNRNHLRSLAFKSPKGRALVRQYPRLHLKITDEDAGHADHADS